MVDTSDFVWETPPPPASGGRGRASKLFTQDVQEALKAHPGKWMVLLPEASASNVSNAQSWAKRRQGYKVQSRTVNPDSVKPYKLYACFSPSEVESD